MLNLNNEESWEHDETLVDHLARELIRGRLALVLGAGTSQFYGLPKWDELVARLCASVGEPIPTAGTDPLVKVGAIRAKYFSEASKFLDAVSGALYENITLDFEKVRQNSTLAALGSLIMSSRRGSASTVINFNYDDLLEIFLEYHGFVTASIYKERHWQGGHDVTIYHPHGFLPLSEGKTRSADIVLGVDEYHRIMDTGSQNLWRPLLQTTLRTHTFLIIGLSGTDTHLHSLLSPLKGQHAFGNERLAFLGVHFLDQSSSQDIRTLMRSWKVFPKIFGNYSELPSFLFRICQRAREIRILTDNI